LNGYKGHAPFIDNSGAEITQVHHDLEDIVNCALSILQRITRSHDLCLDKWGPSAVLGSRIVRNAFESVNNRGARIRLITEVSKENLVYCKEFTAFAEVRHLQKVMGNFSISDAKWYTASSVSDKDKPPKRLIVSNVQEIAEQHQYFFETLWDKAVPLEARIVELEQGLTPQRTTIVESPGELAGHLRRSIESSSWLNVCSPLGDLGRVHEIASASLEEVLEKHGNGNHRGLKWIGHIDVQDLPLVKHYLELGMEIRHASRVLLNFLVTDKEFNFTVSNVEQGEATPSVLMSNEPPYIRQFNSLFTEIWSSGIDAEERIRQILEGQEHGDINIIRNPGVALDTYKRLIRNAQHEIMILFPSKNSIERQSEVGMVDLLKEKLAQSPDSLKIRLIAPYQAMKGESADNIMKSALTGKNKGISVRAIGEIQTGYKATVVVTDGKAALMMEQKNDLAETFEDAIGLSTFSESRPGVMSYASIFESLWSQTELYDQVKRANEQLELAYEQLEEHDRLQKEFINIAAHELRTPVQPLLGMADILIMESEGTDKVEITKDELELIIRNAKRLERLSSDILQVTRIESNKLELQKEITNLNDEIRNVIVDVKKSIASSGRKIEIRFDPKAEPIQVLADRSRISEVLSNLIDNATKFTSEGSIVVTSGLLGTAGQSRRGAFVKVIDCGRGIDPEIYPRLFTKFATKSDKGTGLGLYISKSIIQAHGGRIWAENNVERRGATFAFTLPLAA
jgi:signal transduction histidine kinase